MERGAAGAADGPAAASRRSRRPSRQRAARPDTPTARARGWASAPEQAPGQAARYSFPPDPPPPANERGDQAADRPESDAVGGIECRRATALDSNPRVPSRADCGSGNSTQRVLAVEGITMSIQFQPEDVVVAPIEADQSERSGDGIEGDRERVIRPKQPGRDACRHDRCRPHRSRPSSRSIAPASLEPRHDVAPGVRVEIDVGNRDQPARNAVERRATECRGIVGWHDGNNEKPVVPFGPVSPLNETPKVSFQEFQATPGSRPNPAERSTMGPKGAVHIDQRGLDAYQVRWGSDFQTRETLAGRRVCDSGPLSSHAVASRNHLFRPHRPRTIHPTRMKLQKGRRLLLARRRESRPPP